MKGFSSDEIRAIMKREAPGWAVKKITADSDGNEWSVIVIADNGPLTDRIFLIDMRTKRISGAQG